MEREEEEAPVLPVAKEAGLLRLLRIRVRPPKRLLPWQAEVLQEETQEERLRPLLQPLQLRPWLLPWLPWPWHP